MMHRKPNEGEMLRYIILDDDPTGIQTVHGCYVLTDWNDDVIRTALGDSVPFFYILTNTRACGRTEARKRVAEAVRTVTRLHANTNERLVFISRSDSTLRSHFPLELDTICSEAIPDPDARIFVPAFFEGGRITDSDTHYVLEGETRIRADQTEFARDSVFGYRTSYLPGYITEKTKGGVQEADIASLTIDELRGDSETDLIHRLMDLSGGNYLIVNAVRYDDLDVFARACGSAMRAGKSFVFHGAASIVKSLTETDSRPLVRPTSESVRRGIVVAGSHVQKTTRQLERLFELPLTEKIELDVHGILDDAASVCGWCVEQIERALADGRIPVVYTSRTEAAFGTTAERLEAGARISDALVSIVRQIRSPLDFLVSKGGITSHEILTRGLGVRMARVEGQAEPGVPVIRIDSHDGMLYVIFPGNVGSDATLTEVVAAMSGL